MGFTNHQVDLLLAQEARNLLPAVHSFFESLDGFAFEPDGTRFDQRWVRIGRIGAEGRSAAEPTRRLLILDGPNSSIGHPPDDIDDFMFWPAGRNEAIVRLAQLVAPGGSFAEVPSSDEGIIGENPVFLKALKKARRLARFGMTTLITGETGCGKEVVARYLHYNGARRDKPFVPVNCGALPDSLFESEMFGHTAGAFTDARSAAQGLVEQADGGTMFLDEVDALSAHGQVALLRFLQDGSYRAVGCGRERKADVHIIAATNKPPETLLEGRLRDDLFYRLCASRLAVPPLRDRVGDILLLADHFLRELADRFPQEGAKRIGPDLQGWMLAQPWPGNVRELRSAVQNLYVLSDGRELKPPRASGSATAKTDFGTRKRRAIAAYELHNLKAILRSHHGNVSAAARAAGKERKTFSRLLKKHNIDRTEFSSD